MKENSIEEDIKNAEHFIKSIKTDKEYKEDGWHGYYNKEIVELTRILEHILSDYKRVLKENEELKRLVAHKNGYTKKLEEDLFENCSNYVIPKQKVKDKIEEYKKMLLSCNRFSDVDRIKAINERILELQELLEGRK
nr:MAG TPA: hypothetical protein [Caudoviricetes sp.]